MSREKLLLLLMAELLPARVPGPCPPPCPQPPRPCLPAPSHSLPLRIISSPAGWGESAARTLLPEEVGGEQQKEQEGLAGQQEPGQQGLRRRGPGAWGKRAPRLRLPHEGSRGLGAGAAPSTRLTVCRVAPTPPAPLP